MLSNSTCVLIYSLTIQFDIGVKDSCSENFVTFPEKYPWGSLLKEVTLCRVLISFERSAPPNMIS